MCVCVCVCLSVHDHIFGSPRQISKLFVHVNYDRESVLLWRRSDMLCTSGYMDDLIFVHKPLEPTAVVQPVDCVYTIFVTLCARNGMR